ncbi:MAG: replication terminator protein [Psychrobacillus psychrotolerans]|uniref:replication terminator protein n=1 Tax=Psychrobacillus psychrotolerans TaxID=126156 RepID=UPI003BB20F3E
MKQIIDLNTFASGALSEKVNIEIQKVLDNIADPNTDHKKARKVTVSITLKANEKRNLANVIVDTKSTLVPAVGVETELIIDYTTDGQVTGAELKSGIPGQAFISEHGEILDDQGKPLAAEEPVNSKVVQFK